MAARNLAELVRAAAHEHPTKPALIEADRVVSWAELDALVDRAAGALLGSGRVRGDRVGILLPNSIDFAVAYFGCLRAGLVAVPLNIAYTPSELAYQVTDAVVANVITDSELAPSITDRFDEQVLLVGEGGSWEQLLAAATPATEAQDADAAGGEDIAILLYTSGTTGRPRGAMLSHRALLANLDQLVRIHPPVVDPDDKVLLVLPLFHVYGLNSGLGMVARAGSTGILARRFDPVETLALVRDRQVSCIIGAPPMYLAWSMLPDLGDSLSSVRLALSGAAPLPVTVLASVLDASGHHIFEGYGLTETAPVLTTTLCSSVPKPGSVGKPVPGVEVKIVNESDDDEVEDDDPGELVVRGDNLFSGYWPDGTEGPDSDGWFRTGDIAYADDDGDLFLVDRTRELILVSGFNVYPREVEDVLLDHPGVAEVAVIGIPHPYTGETVKALVVLRDDARVDAEALVDHAAARLARFKCPTVIEFVDELPHSVTGKVAKGRLRETADSSE
ncbi:MAG: AMP-binding protein [Frankiaceae bacterium]|nr:AMP-binding protein [Frankiaceae bacterium]MBV9870224.1 AMP-binding protein [Frankiaceae bacterium]